MHNELDRFKLHLLQGKGAADGKLVKRSPRTVESRIQILRRLMLHSPQLEVVELQQHLLRLWEEGKKGTYLNNYVITLRLFGRLKGTKKYEKISFFQTEEYEASPLSDEEIERFLQLPPPTVTKYDKKSNSMVTYQFNSGWDMWTMFWKLFSYHLFRPGGIARLTVDDIDFGLGAIHSKDKTGKRTLSIHPAVLGDLKAYIATLKTYHLFPAKHGGERQGGIINEKNWGLSFHNRIKRLGIKRTNLTPYSLRHSTIVRLIDGGVSPLLVMTMAGQKDFNTLLHYYHKSLKAMREANKKDSLGRKMLPKYERKKMYRELAFKLLEDFANDSEEEREFVEFLKIYS